MVKESAKQHKHIGNNYNDYTRSGDYYPSNENNQNDGSHFGHQDTPEQMMPIPPPVPIQSLGLLSMVTGKGFVGGTFDYP